VFCSCETPYQSTLRYVYTDTYCRIITGTGIPSTREMPETLKKEQNGDCFDSEIKYFFLALRSKHKIVMLATFHTASINKMTKVFSKSSNKCLIKKPNVVLDHIKHVGEALCIDHCTASYQYIRRK
jgi:hypothetical protein